MMENKENEAWFEGVIIGSGMTQFVNEMMMQHARHAVADLGFKDGVAPWRGPLHVWPPMLSHWSWSNHVLLYLLWSWLFFSDLRGKAEYHSPNVPLGPMQVSMARADCLIIGGWCDLWVKPEKRVQGVRVHQWRSQRRVDSICEGYQIRECIASEYQGEVEDEGVMCACVGVYMTGGSGSKVRETIHRGRSQRTNNHGKHQGIVGEA